MGFIDKFKDMQGQAQEAATAAQQSAAGMGGMGGAYKGKVGEEITVNVDPGDPNSMLLWG